MPLCGQAIYASKPAAMVSQSLAPYSDRAVLIVDNDAAVRGSLQFRLELEGFPVRTYASGSDLLEDIDIPETGCLVIDYRLPGMNGLDLLSELRRRKVIAPAILTTSGPGASLSVRTAAVGAALIEKPLLNEALFDGIRAAMRRSLPGCPS